MLRNVPFTTVSAENAAPAIGAAQADSGALAAGDYEVIVTGQANDTNAVGKGLVVQHRNAANSANVAQFAGCPAPGEFKLHLPRIRFAANERIRVAAGSAAGAVSSQYVSSVSYRKISDG